MKKIKTNTLLNELTRAVVIVAILGLLAMVVFLAQNSSSNLQGSFLAPSNELISTKELPKRDIAENVSLTLTKGENETKIGEKSILTFEIKNNSEKEVRIGDIYYNYKDKRVEIVDPNMSSNLYLSGGTCNSAKLIGENESCELEFTFFPKQKFTTGLTLVIGVIEKGGEEIKNIEENFSLTGK